MDAINTGAEFARQTQERALIDSGVRYCVVHHGLIDVDSCDCDFSLQEPLEHEGECVSRPLFYEEVPNDG